MFRSKSNTEKALDRAHEQLLQASELSSSTAGQVREKVGPAVAQAAQAALAAKEWTQPHVEAARDWAKPHVEHGIEVAAPRVETAVQNLRPQGRHRPRQDRRRRAAAHHRCPRCGSRRQRRRP